MDTTDKSIVTWNSFLTAWIRQFTTWLSILFVKLLFFKLLNSILKSLVVKQNSIYTDWTASATQCKSQTQSAKWHYQTWLN